MVHFYAAARVAALLAAFIVFPTQAQPSTTSSPPPASTSDLPIVDLGYELHQALAFNEAGRYYNFSNIRYAAPATGENRWRAPQPPVVNRSSVETGSRARTCPQAYPKWVLTTGPSFDAQYLAGKRNFTQSDFKTTNVTFLPDGPTVDEDCLFLDVMVPEKIFKSAGKGYGAPVLVWIYGGGFTGGDKVSSGSPASLLARSQDDNAQGVIFTAMNYRLGAFGWQSGPTLQESNGTPNAGLYDQRFALEWIQRNIHLFGGDPNKVTVLGESAGGGSIMHQITAYGGAKGKVPFQQAIPQSPGFVPLTSNQQQELNLQNYLALLNVSTLEEARKLPYEKLQKANLVQVSASPYGSFLYGPAVDGDFVPQLPGVLLARGQFDPSVRVMLGHNANEGLLFTSPFNSNTSALENQLENVIPTIRAFPDVMDRIANQLYPEVFDGSQAMGYNDQLSRASALISEFIFTCNTFYLDKAFENKTYSYVFSVPPALHGSDVGYTFFNGDNSTNATIATALQDYITSFAMNGNPNEHGVPYFNTYGANATIQNLNITGIREGRDATANERCNFWQKALYT